MNNPYKKFLLNVAQATFVVVLGFITTTVVFKLMAEVSPIEDGLLTTVNLFFDIGVYIICILYSWRNLTIDIERKEKSYFSCQEEKANSPKPQHQEKYDSIPVYPVFAKEEKVKTYGNKNKTFDILHSNVYRQEEILRQIEEQNMAQMEEMTPPPVMEEVIPPDPEIW